MKGKRILVLLDTSASMMDDDVVKIIRLRNQPEAARALAPKWRRALDMVEWVTRAAAGQQPVPGVRLQREGEGRAWPTPTGKWLASNDPRAINNVLTAARNITPGDGTSLVNALLVGAHASTRSPTRSS